MRARAHDVRRLDVALAAADAAVLTGACPLADLERLAEGARDGMPVQWEARFSRRAQPAGGPQTWLHLGASARVQRDCQRCLRPVDIDLVVDRSFRFVADEATADRLDVDSEEDVVALSRQFDLMALVEDELLLALPLVPKHERCSEPLPVPAPPSEEESTPRPFAALVALKANTKR